MLRYVQNQMLAQIVSTHVAKIVLPDLKLRFVFCNHIEMVVIITIL